MKKKFYTKLRSRITEHGTILKPITFILETDEHGEITVNVVSGDHDGLTAAICTALAQKLMGGEQFQEEIMEIVDAEGKG